jgi:hypothetical protein
MEIVLLFKRLKMLSIPDFEEADRKIRGVFNLD